MSLPVEVGEGWGFGFEEFDELGGGGVEECGGGFEVEVCGVDGVEGFGEEVGEVGMVFGDGDAGVFDAGLPEVGGGGVGEVGGCADGEGEFDAEAFDGGGFVLFGASSFGGFCADICGEVLDGDGGFDFVTVLAAWS